MNAAFMKVLRERKNLLWMCDECVKLMQIPRFKTVMSSVSSAVSSIEDSHRVAISELKEAFSVNSKQMQQLSKKVTETASTPLSSKITLREPPLKRRREERMMTSLPPLIGTKSTTSLTVPTVPPPKELFWLYMSRFHPSVKSETVTELVRDCLQCEDPIKVIPLLKKDADLNAMNFISFKIGLDKKYRSVALDPGTWPNGIAFREFDNPNSKSYWAPPNNHSLLTTPRIEVTPVGDFLSANTEPGSSQMESA
ncbi:uncharacterized protein LOC128736042 [Sabethes cyaneus]|uniref:uncharacterized protein LOC128736042 n=1 Tax=Sabethes cyaneus TaxID=53552 RepID=UPI00237D486E|nr:uncharacterized protein LOC128736042 [Sabethes cyaneus]